MYPVHVCVLCMYKCINEIANSIEYHDSIRESMVTTVRANCINDPTS